jgi:hypothetical protein
MRADQASYSAGIAQDGDVTASGGLSSLCRPAIGIRLVVLACLAALAVVQACLLFVLPPPTPHPTAVEADGMRRSILAPTLNLDDWATESYNGDWGDDHVTAGAIVANCVRTDGTGWHFQIHQDNVTLLEGKKYTLLFDARADQPSGLWVEAVVDQGDFHDVGLHQHVNIGTAWRAYRMTFTAHKVIPGHILAPQFEMGEQVGTIRLANISLAMAN